MKLKYKISRKNLFFFSAKNNIEGDSKYSSKTQNSGPNS